MNQRLCVFAGLGVLARNPLYEPQNVSRKDAKSRQDAEINARKYLPQLSLTGSRLRMHWW